MPVWLSIDVDCCLLLLSIGLYFHNTLRVCMRVSMAKNDQPQQNAFILKTDQSCGLQLLLRHNHWRQHQCLMLDGNTYHIHSYPMIIYGIKYPCVYPYQYPSIYVQMFIFNILSPVAFQLRSTFPATFAAHSQQPAPRLRPIFPRVAFEAFILRREDHDGAVGAFPIWRGSPQREPQVGYRRLVTAGWLPQVGYRRLVSFPMLTHPSLYLNGHKGNLLQLVYQYPLFLIDAVSLQVSMSIKVILSLHCFVTSFLGIIISCSYLYDCHCHQHYVLCIHALYMHIYIYRERDIEN